MMSYENEGNIEVWLMRICRQSLMSLYYSWLDLSTSVPHPTPTACSYVFCPPPLSPSLSILPCNSAAHCLYCSFTSPSLLPAMQLPFFIISLQPSLPSFSVTLPSPFHLHTPSQWYCRGSLLRCDNWQVDLDKQIRSRINLSIANDCRTLWSCKPSSIEYSFVCRWWRPTWPKRSAINCYWLIDSATYLLIKIYLPIFLLSLHFHTPHPLHPSLVLSPQCLVQAGAQAQRTMQRPPVRRQRTRGWRAEACPTDTQPYHDGKKWRTCIWKWWEVTKSMHKVPLFRF